MIAWSIDLGWGSVSALALPTTSMKWPYTAAIRIDPPLSVGTIVVIVQVPSAIIRGQLVPDVGWDERISR